jgi:hypothetical protein
MPLATGPFRQLRIKKETTWGTLAGTSGGQLMRRKSFSLDEKRNTYSSQEVRTDQQTGLPTHGTRSAEGMIDCELSGGTYQLLLQSLCRRDFTAFSSITGLSLTMAGSGPTYTVTRSAGDFLTGGVKVGMVVRITAGSVNSNNLNKNLFVVGVTATVLTVVPWGNGTMTAEGPIATCTIAAPGKLTYVPASSHTNDSYTVEDWHSDITQSEVYAGMRVSGFDFKAPATGNIEASIKMLGKGLSQTATSAYFSSPTAATTSGAVTAVNGVLRFAGAQQASVTSLSFNVDGQAEVGQVVGSNFTPDVFMGPIVVKGQLSAYFDSATIRDAFLNESTVALNVVAYAGTTAGAEFLAFTLPALKLTSRSKPDSQRSIIQTFDFEAGYNSAGGSGVDSEATVFWVQDSLVS